MSFPPISFPASDYTVTERFLRYVTVDTQSDPDSPTTPSTARQKDLGQLLVADLREIGLSDAEMDADGYVYATLPANTDKPVPVICFCSHMDTSPDAPGAGVKPQVWRNYQGGDIALPGDPTQVVRFADHAALKNQIGNDIVTSDGTTLLGADDKAGLAEIVDAVRFLAAHPQIKHGTLKVLFTPDEEIGRGVDDRLPKDLACDFAYTLDGSKVGEIEFESFSADLVEITIKGVSIHPGWAKDKLVIAIHLASKIVATLPQATMTPETTEGRDGFIHAVEMSGGSSEMKITLILRDFERDGLAAKGELLRQVCETVAATEPRATITCDIRPQYRNMRYWLEKDMTPVELARAASKAVGVEPVSVPIRGGTDGSLLTEKGVPTPNLFTGMQNIHGPLEWVSVGDMAVATELCVKLVELATEGSA